MHSSSQQPCEAKIISYTEEEPKAQEDSHPPPPAAVLQVRPQCHSLIKDSRQRLKIGLSLLGDRTSLTRVWGLNCSGLKHSQGHGIGLTRYSLAISLLAVVVGLKCILGHLPNCCEAVPNL